MGVGAMASAAPDGSAPVGAGIGPSASDAVQAVDAAYRVLIVEDDRSQGLFAQTILRGAGIESNVVSEATEVMSALRQLKPDLVLMDLHLERLTGLKLVKAMVHRGGINAAVFGGGMVTEGAVVRPVSDEEAARRGAPTGADRPVPRIVPG